MSRIDGPRWRRILLWTGAAMAWGTAVTAARLEPARLTASEATDAVSTPISATQQPALPRPPEKGLIILRFTPSQEETPEVRTVYLRQPAGRAQTTSAAPAPAPVSRGS